MEMERLAVEAILFSSDKPLTSGKIADVISITREEVEEIIESLIRDYRERNTAIEIIRLGDKYVMRIKPQFVKYVDRMVERDLDRGTLRTLAVIAYNQPIKMSDLARKRGNKAYQHVKRLLELGLISGKKAGRTKILETTSAFNTYFNIEGDGKETIKEKLKELS
jgi:segregation and condensation protein B